MPCDTSCMEYGCSRLDHEYGRHLYLHPKRDEIKAAGGILAAIQLGIATCDEFPSFFSHDDSPERDFIQMLCSVCDAYASGQPWDEFVDKHPEVKTWVEGHQYFDTLERERQQQVDTRRELKKSAWAKLTEEEAKAIGFTCPDEGAI